MTDKFRIPWFTPLRLAHHLNRHPCGPATHLAQFTSLYVLSLLSDSSPRPLLFLPPYPLASRPFDYPVLFSIYFIYVQHSCSPILDESDRLHDPLPSRTTRYPFCRSPCNRVTVGTRPATWVFIFDRVGYHCSLATVKVADNR